MHTELESYAQLAKSILNGTTPYSFAKNSIRALFETEFRLDRYNTNCLRLTVIDSYYSTNMSKRYYGIEDVATRLGSISESDPSLASYFIDFISKPTSKHSTIDLFEARYGTTKAGKPASRAASLISKYAYFLTHFSFPIYDSLARESLRRLSKSYPAVVPALSSSDSVEQFFIAIADLNQHFGDFDLLDNLLWLIGKVKEGNLSLVMERSRFQKIIDATGSAITYQSLLNLSRGNHNSQDLLGPKLTEFIRFVRELP